MTNKYCSCEKPVTTLRYSDGSGADFSKCVRCNKSLKPQPTLTDSQQGEEWVKEFDEEIYELAERLDYRGLAEAFAKGDIDWHEEEWKKFISNLLAKQRQADKEAVMKSIENLPTLSNQSFEIRQLLKAELSLEIESIYSQDSSDEHKEGK